MSGKLFRYENIRVSDDRTIVEFDYQIETDAQTFSLTESLTLPSPLISNSTIDKALRALHLALGISYYKTFIPPEIDHGYAMDENEAGFWNDVFTNGLGEFLYTNKLTASQLAKFSPQEGTIKIEGIDDVAWTESALLGIGGGKDSIVAGELLKQLDVPAKGFVLATGENRGQAQAVADIMGVAMLGVERRLDQQILEMNKLDGAYNGHVPISLIFALVGCLLAVNEASSYVVVANEASASIPQVNHNGNSVNHQWSKSFKFEQSFQEFVHAYITPSLHYTSIIRPLTSIAVAKIFSNYPEYFETFTSDNSHFKIKQEARKHPRWSEDSSKSLSSYILLAPWLSDADLERTFGMNYLDQNQLTDLFLALLGRTDTPILDCVGTPDELRLSISMLAEQNRFTNSELMRVAKDSGVIIGSTAGALGAALELSSKNALPENLRQRVIDKLTEDLND